LKKYKVGFNSDILDFLILFAMAVENSNFRRQQHKNKKHPNGKK